MLEDCACMDVSYLGRVHVVLEWYSTFLTLNIEDPCGGPVTTPLNLLKICSQPLLGWASHHLGPWSPVAHCPSPGNGKQL